MPRRSAKPDATAPPHRPRVLVIDIGGTNVKILASGHSQPRKFPSGPQMTPQQMVEGVKRSTADWNFDVVSVGYPGPVVRGRPVAEPHNLAGGWVDFDFARAFGCPVRIINDAAMQALGSYKGGRMLFLGLGTGLGTTLIINGIVAPMELGHLPYKKRTFEDYIGVRGLESMGKSKWQAHVTDVVARLSSALQADEVVLGGGNVRNISKLPPKCRAGDNANAFLGGFRLWENDTHASTEYVKDAQPLRRQAAHPIKREAAGQRARRGRLRMDRAGRTLQARAQGAPARPVRR